MRLDLDQEAKLRRMVAGGFTLAGIAEHLGCTIHKAKLLVHEYGLRKQALPRGPRHKPNDFQLREVPLSDPVRAGCRPRPLPRGAEAPFPRADTMTWHVLFTDSRCEQETAHEIQADLGFPAFCPTEKHKRFRHGRKTIIESALFARYIFVAFDAEDNWPALLEVEGVCDVLRNDGKPSPVPDAIVPKLMRMQQNGLFDHTRAPNPFPPKSSVEIDDDGPFAGLIAEVRGSDRPTDAMCCCATSGGK